MHEAVVAHHATARFALDLHAGDVFWCTADPGWVTGTSYGIIAPLTHGATLISYAGEFDARAWYRLLDVHRVNVWYTAPTALRMLLKYGADAAQAHDLSALRHIASVGEALNPEVVTWGMEAYGKPIHDNWWQTETGAIMVSNYPGMEIRPGSMGRPMPGIEAAVLVRGENGRALVEDGEVRVADPGVTGELALRPGWPSMFRGYLGEEERYQACFAGGWYVSGDLARTDEDGYVWFVGRADDVIKSAGHLIGPFEVETALMEHPAVVESGVIGKPDPVAGEVVKAFVTLRHGFEPTEELRRELLAFGRRRLGGLAPKEIDFDQHLPHTRSGKVMRRLLKARELGLPEGDLSTLEADPVSAQPSQTEHHQELLRTMLADPALRGALRRALQRHPDPRLPAPLHRRGGGGHRRDVGAAARGRGGVDLPRARARPGPRGAAGLGDGGDVRPADRVQPRPRRLDAPVRQARRTSYGGNAVVAGGIPLAVGLALADRMQGRDRVTACFFGDGAVAEGEFHEAMNLAALWRLPVLFCCENNRYAMGTSLAKEHAQTDLALRAASYGMAAWPVDGMDVLAVEDAATRAVEEIRGGGAPEFLELRTYRFRAHSMYDPDRYRDKDEIAAWRAHDPLLGFQELMQKEGQLDEDELAALENEVAALIDRGGRGRRPGARGAGRGPDPLRRLSPAGGE